MHVFMSWARSTVTQLERSLGRSENYFDRILIGVLALLAVAVLFLFTAELTAIGRPRRFTERTVLLRRTHGTVNRATTSSSGSASSGSGPACRGRRPGCRGTWTGPR